MGTKWSCTWKRLSSIWTVPDIRNKILFTLGLLLVYRVLANFTVPLDMEEFQTFYQENLGMIYRYIYSKVGNREEAEDLTSQIFLKVVSDIDHDRSRESIQKWLFLVARTTLADYWRTHYRLPLSSLDELLDAGWEVSVEEEPTVTSSSAADQVKRILQALPEHYREVLECRFLLNLSIKATASKMGITVANVKVLQFRALKRAAALEQVITEQQRSAL
jgi:RNA polymerase sigma-70 factor (ECF subfamily)